MSDGMNFAYATDESRAILQALINKLAANQRIRFYGLADEKISPLEYSHTHLYNYMLNPGSYDKQKAPIEHTLKRIVDENQPAVLITDFEEYKGQVIEKAAYAKRSFIDWLAKGNTITFYKWDFEEKGKAKHMFVTVFDDKSEQLNSLIANAMTLANANPERYVLVGHDFSYPVGIQYLSINQGGNYHNAKGVDAVTAVSEKGGSSDYFNYSKPLASALGTPGQFASLDYLSGAHAEFYPLGVNWSDALVNAKQMQEEGISDDNRYYHFLSNLYIDFGAQNGFNIDAVEVRVFDMGETMKTIAQTYDSIKAADIESIGCPEVNMFLTAAMHNAKDKPLGWKEITIDFDPQFKGSFAGGIETTTLFRANVVISKATSNIADVDAFFAWPGNPSLANSIKETLSAETSNPEGCILYTYYIKTISE